MLKIKYYNSGKIAALLFVGLLCLTACSKSNKNDPIPEPVGSKNQYALLTGDLSVSPYVGYLTTYTEVPSGSLQNVKEGSLSVKANGIKYYGGWIFQRLQLGKTQSTDDGILRYSLNAKGNLVHDKEIKGMSSNFYVYDDIRGYYADTDRGLMKLQIFNPSSMQRTGEIDLSQLSTKEYGPYQSVGANFIAAKEGKLFVDITYGTNEGKGSFLIDEPKGFVEVAIIDIATGKFEKTIKDTRVSYIGYPGNANQMWAMGDDGALYICSHGFSKTGATNGSSILRIKKGETEFDKNWIIKVDDYSKNTSAGTVAVKDGILYTSWGSQPLAFAGMLKDAIYSYYAFDKENIAAGPQKIEGIPETTNSFQNGQAITVIDGKVYFRSVNNKETNGYYVLDGKNKAKQAFNITAGGTVWGFAKLTPQ